MKKIHKYSPIALHDGDVIVVMKQNFISKMIAKLTNRGTGDWSHVGMVVTYNDIKGVQEALKQGVVFSNINEFFKRYDAWVILRPIIMFDRRVFNSEAYRYYGKMYSYFQLFLDYIATLKQKISGRQVYRELKKDPHGVTCPEWIGRVYEHFGVKVQTKEGNGMYIAPNYLSPCDFIDSSNFDILADSHEKYGKVFNGI